MKRLSAILIPPIAGLALFFSMVACTAPPPRNGLQVVDPDRRHAVTATIQPANKQNAVGLWQLDMFMLYDLRANGTISASASYAGAEVYQGKWQVLPDGRVYMAIHPVGEMTGTLRGNVLVAGEEPNSNMSTVLRRVDTQGNLMPANIIKSDVPLPLFDPAKVTAIRIDESWWGLSLDAPVVSQITLTVGSNVAVGEAFYSKGSAKSVSTTVSITVPMSAMAKSLVALSQVPVEAGPYRPFINHTDDYPQIRIELALPDGNVVFETRSQGWDNLPWRVVVNGKEYVTYSDLPTTAIQVINPHLKRDVQEKLGQ